MEEQEVINSDRIEKIVDLIEGRKFNELRKHIGTLEPGELAEILSELGNENELVVFRLLPRDLSTQVFEYLPVNNQESLLKAFGDEDMSKILNDMSPDDRTAFLEELPAKVTKRLLNLLSPEERKVARKLLGYPEQSIGRLMTPHYITVKEEWTMPEVLEHVRKFGQDSETLNVLYVVNNEGILLDDIQMRDILLADPPTTVAVLMDQQVPSLMATDDQETAIKTFSRYDRSALPVTDSTGVMVGIVTVDDVLDIAEEEATEDIQKMGGTESLEEPYLTISLKRMIRKRSIWLVFLFFGQMLTITALGAFEDELAKVIFLTAFIPLIISSGGNSGSQAATLVIRALTIGEIRLKDWWKVMHREFFSGLFIGGLLGLLGFVRIYLWEVLYQSYGPYWYLLGITVWISLIGVVLWGTLSGSLLPLVLKRVGIDPASASAPFVATMVDVVGILIYFSVAMTILRGKLL